MKRSPIPKLTLLFTLLVLFSQAGEAKSATEKRTDRDPFLALPSKGGEDPKEVTPERPPISRSTGLTGIRIGDISLVGIIFSGELCLAILKVQNQFTYIARVGSNLFDGRVLLITSDGILFSQDTQSPDNTTTVFKTFRRETPP